MRAQHVARYLLRGLERVIRGYIDRTSLDFSAGDEHRVDASGYVQALFLGLAFFLATKVERGRTLLYIKRAGKTV